MRATGIKFLKRVFHEYYFNSRKGEECSKLYKICLEAKMTDSIQKYLGQAQDGKGKKPAELAFRRVFVRGLFQCTLHSGPVPSDSTPQAASVLSPIPVVSPCTDPPSAQGQIAPRAEGPRGCEVGLCGYPKTNCGKGHASLLPKIWKIRSPTFFFTILNLKNS